MSNFIIINEKKIDWVALGLIDFKLETFRKYLVVFGKLKKLIQNLFGLVALRAKNIRLLTEEGQFVVTNRLKNQWKNCLI